MRVWHFAVLSMLFAPAAQAKCRFTLTDDVNQSLVRPALELHLGDEAKWYEVSKPAVEIDGDTVELIFLNGQPNVLDAPLVLLVLEGCGSRVAAVYWARPFPGEPWNPLSPKRASETGP